MKNISAPSIFIGILIGALSCSAIVIARNDFFDNKKTNIENQQKSFDAVFLEDMIPHHEGAIQMSQAALENLQNEDVKKLAEDIITAQEKEIELMQYWYKTWFNEEIANKSALTNSMGNHAHHMGVMNGNINALTTGKNTDQEFLEQMIPHHEMAVMMAQMLLKTTNREELQQFAENIITLQNAEIAQMKELLKNETK